MKDEHSNSIEKNRNKEQEKEHFLQYIVHFVNPPNMLLNRLTQ